MDMDFIDFGMGAAFTQPPNNFSSAHSVDHMLRGKLAELERKVARMELVQAALWELIRDNTRLSNADIEARMKEIDLRDGKEDGKITEVPLRCPTCGRVSSSKHWKCLYCGLEFERATF